MRIPAPLEIGGYVLAGGKSSRMGTNKALLRLAGKPLIEHAVTKLRRICRDVRILSSDPVMAPYAPLVADLHPGCGPIGGIEAALAGSVFEWNLFLPVDLPFLPAAFLEGWVRITLADSSGAIRIALCTADGTPQPTVLLIHRDAAPYVAQAVDRGDFKMFRMLESIGRDLAARTGRTYEEVLQNTNCNDAEGFRPFWFANLNTPQEFADAEANAGALED